MSLELYCRQIWPLPCHSTAVLTWLLVCLPPRDYILHFLSPRRAEFGKEGWEASGSFLLFALSVTGSGAVSWTALNLAANFHLRSLFCLDDGWEGSLGERGVLRFYLLNCTPRCVFCKVARFSRIIKPQQGPGLTVCQDLQSWKIGLNSVHPFERDSSKSKIRDLKNDIASVVSLQVGKSFSQDTIWLGCNSEALYLWSVVKYYILQIRGLYIGQRWAEWHSVRAQMSSPTFSFCLL